MTDRLETAHRSYSPPLEPPLHTPKPSIDRHCSPTPPSRRIPQPPHHCSPTPPPRHVHQLPRHDLPTPPPRHVHQPPRHDVPTPPPRHDVSQAANTFPDAARIIEPHITRSHVARPHIT
ncbi:hypothetical protein FPV67DRAFT_1677019 [Lyophyllum atratum]|nr:hypothetical protein FPV67DRAFT_1677019 [Lyophyllum atratum]